MELGTYTFAELTPSAETGETISPERRISDLLEEIELAEQVGLEVAAIGEHHRPDFAVSAPAVVLGAAAARTGKIRLSSAVTVLSSDDPIRVFQDFATIDLISSGRAEIMAGRGSFIESFPLFGYSLDDYDELFEEKLELLIQARDEEVVSWQGRHRPSIDGRGVYPRPVQEQIPIWLAAGGNPGSAVRAGTMGLPLALAIIGGNPSKFAPFADLYRRAAEASGHDGLPMSINSHGFIAETSEEAIEESFIPFKTMMDRIGRERGWPEMTRAQFDASCNLDGANFIGTPAEVTEKILHQHKIFNHDRLLIQFTVGTMPHEKVLRSIELFGTEVAPAVRAQLARG